ncbi:MAG: hypothetical protein KatS3mg109_0068 [Pirellulaceae bacterium]|nr:MAG: hypothetical protein KatS3mg109_0068 [Pirellulaceae bacterium]
MPQKPTYAELANSDSQRPAAWRYERAVRIIERQKGKWSGSRDDELTKMTVKYLLTRRRLSSVLDPDRLNETLLVKFRDLHRCYERFRLPVGDPSRYVLEARLLAGQTGPEIEEREAIPSIESDLYEQVFFCVKDRLDQIGYIARVIIGDVFQSGIGNLNKERMAKYFGYFAGPTMLDFVLYAFNTRASLATDGDVIAFLDNQIQRNWRLQTAVMSTVLQPSKFDIRAVFEGYSSLLAAEARAVATSDQSEWVNSLVSALVKSTPIPRGSEARNLEDPVLKSYATGHVELRGGEQLDIAAGSKLPYYGLLEQYEPPTPGEDDDAEN